MISKKMYRVLKHIPRAPGRTSLKEMYDKEKTVRAHVNQVRSILLEAKKANYIAFSNKAPSNNLSTDSIYLTETGQIGMDEYKHRLLDSRRSLWALIISIIGLILSTTISIVGLLLQAEA